MRNATNVRERVTALSTTSEHAVRACLFLARTPGERPVTAREAAEALGMPENYLSKTLGALVRVGVLKSHRGPAGGFRLALDAGSVSLSRIVDAVDPPRKVARCLVGPGPCDPANPCTLHGRWRTIERELRSPLERTTLRDLLDTSEN